MAILCFGCSSRKSEKGIDTYGNIKDELHGAEMSIGQPKANIEEFEMEINNGGLSQYFLNSGMNCFETQRELKKLGKIQTAAILERAISLINPKGLQEQELIEKLRKREVKELFDSSIEIQLNELDKELFKYPDGPLDDSVMQEE